MSDIISPSIIEGNPRGSNLAHLEVEGPQLPLSNLSDTADRHGFPPYCLRSWCKRGLVPHFQIADEFYFDSVEMTDWLMSCHVTPRVDDAVEVARGAADAEGAAARPTKNRGAA